MLPNSRLSLYAVEAPFKASNIATNPFSKIDYELGSTELGNPATGLSNQLWTATVNEYNRVVLTSENGQSETLIEIPENIKKLSFAFDQNMRPVIAYELEGNTYLYWFDTSEGEYVTTPFLNVTSPALGLDERRPDYILNSDVVFMYVFNNNLCYRLQRDRYLIEYILEENFNGYVIAIGTNVDYRLQMSVMYNTYGSLSPAPSTTPAPTPTVTPTITLTISVTPSITVSPTITPTITVTPTITPTPSPVVIETANAIHDWKFTPAYKGIDGSYTVYNDSGTSANPRSIALVNNAVGTAFTEVTDGGVEGLYLSTNISTFDYAGFGLKVHPTPLDISAESSDMLTTVTWIKFDRDTLTQGAYGDTEFFQMIMYNGSNVYSQLYVNQRWSVPDRIQLFVYAPPYTTISPDPALFADVMVCLTTVVDRNAGTTVVYINGAEIRVRSSPPSFGSAYYIASPDAQMWPVTNLPTLPANYTVYRHSIYDTALDATEVLALYTAGPTG